LFFVNYCLVFVFFFFFFQAEDGIRDYKVTGVQTCALPIYGRRGPTASRSRRRRAAQWSMEPRSSTCGPTPATPCSRGRPKASSRSEERRVGKECRSRWSPDH